MKKNAKTTKSKAKVDITETDDSKKVSKKSSSTKNKSTKNSNQYKQTETAHGDVELEYDTKMSKKEYEKHLEKLGVELVKMQEWVKLSKLKIVVVFEGRDAAGKGGVIKIIDQFLNPRFCKVVALGVPTEKEKNQWYFQRYVSELPTGGEIALFDRSWYNRAGVEHVMGFCSQDEYKEFLRSCPEFEKMLINSGTILIKYWFSVSNKEQEKRFAERINNPVKRWKISPMDLESRNRWVEFSMAKDAMFAHTNTKLSPWYVVEGDDKKRARLNCINHLLSMIPYENLPEKVFELPPRKPEKNYVRPPKQNQKYVPHKF